MIGAGLFPEKVSKIGFWSGLHYLWLDISLNKGTVLTKRLLPYTILEQSFEFIWIQMRSYLFFLLYFQTKQDFNS